MMSSVKKCTACTACVSSCPKHCIEMKTDQNGFAFPEVAKSSECIKCGACERVCPVLAEKSINKNLPVVYAAYSKDESLRMDSSSGGIFSEVAKLIIEKKGAVYGAAYNNSFEVYHCCVENVADLVKLRGAKYSESRLGNTFFEILQKLKQGQCVLFVGTPCQVAGLKSYVKKDFDNLICIDFVCHGVPSPMVWKEYVRFRAKQDADDKMPIAINLRSKITGWSKYLYSNLFQYENGIEYSNMSSHDLFMKLFIGDYISRPSCEDCHFKGYNRISDITLGDFWGIWDIIPELDDNKGTSVVLIQSKKGKEIWKEVEQNVVCREVSIEQASQQNPSMIVSSKAKENRKEVLGIIRNGGISSCTQLFILKKSSLKIKLKNRVRKFFNNLRMI